MQRMFKCSNIQNISLNHDKKLNSLIYGRIFSVIKYRSYKLVGTVWLFWPTLYNRKCT